MSFAFDRPTSASSEPGISSSLFFSIFPDQRTAARIARLAQDLRRKYRLDGRPILRARFHCSLYGFDRPDGASDILVARAQTAASMVKALPFRVSFNCVTSFSDRAARHPIVLTGDDGAVGLVQLRSSLCGALREIGLRPRKYSSFTPHLTLLYDARRLDEQFIEPIDWIADEFVLVLSLIGRTKHVPLRRWQLQR